MENKTNGILRGPYIPSGLGVIVLLLFALLMGVFALVNPCNQFEKKFQGAEHRALQHFTYAKKTLPTLIHCGRDCHADKRCKSLNYHKCNRLCELNNVTRVQQPEDFIEIPGCMYFDDFNDTSEYSIIFPNTSISSCKKLRERAQGKSGVYTIYPAGFSGGLQVYCDMEPDCGGWIVIQRRQDGSEEFYRNWDEYEAGFGNVSGEFWLGNAAVQQLTQSGGSWKLRIDLEDWEGNTAWAEYSGVQVSGDKYEIIYENYNPDSTAGDSLHSNNKFTTKDQDNDKLRSNCARINEGAWWYTGQNHQCGGASLNGRYEFPSQPSLSRGVFWYSWSGEYYSLKRCTMKISEI